jgi:cathepsin L
MKKLLTLEKSLSSILIIGLTLFFINGCAKEKQIKYFNKTANSKLYQEREKKASPTILRHLDSLRKEIDANHYTFTVGYTKVMDRKLEEITGLITPKNLDSVARVQNKNAKIILDLDFQVKRDFWIKYPDNLIEASANCGCASSIFDWTAYNVVTDVKDQGGCGSCWIFGTVGAFEASYALNSHYFLNPPHIDASEQNILNCVGTRMSCRFGGWPYKAASYIVNNGVAKESDIPYQANWTRCDTNINRPYKALTWGFVDSVAGIPSLSELKQALCEYGPLSVCVFADENFISYTGGVFNEVIPGNTYNSNHCVTLVGWNDFYNAWLIKNSWGLDWGIDGYMWIAYGCNRIGDQALWIKGEGEWDLLPKVQQAKARYNFSHMYEEIDK